MAKDKIAKAFLAITKDKFTIDTIAEMIATKHLADGNIVRLNGYYSAGDGANHIRQISKTNDGSGILLANGLYANIVHDGEVNVSWFGEVTSDTFEFIANTFNIINIDKKVEVDRTINIKKSGGIIKGQGFYKSQNKLIGKNGILLFKFNGKAIDDFNTYQPYCVKFENIYAECGEFFESFDRAIPIKDNDGYPYFMRPIFKDCNFKFNGNLETQRQAGALFLSKAFDFIVDGCVADEFPCGLGHFRGCDISNISRTRINNFKRNGIKIIKENTFGADLSIREMDIMVGECYDGEENTYSVIENGADGTKIKNIYIENTSAKQKNRFSFIRNSGYYSNIDDIRLEGSDNGNKITHSIYYENNIHSHYLKNVKNANSDLPKPVLVNERIGITNGRVKFLTFENVESKNYIPSSMSSNNSNKLIINYSNISLYTNDNDGGNLNLIEEDFSFKTNNITHVDLSKESEFFKNGGVYKIKIVYNSPNSTQGIRIDDGGYNQTLIKWEDLPQTTKISIHTFEVTATKHPYLVLLNRGANIYSIDIEKTDNAKVLNLSTFDTPYHATQMSKLGILDSYHNYLTELHEYEKQQNTQSDTGVMNLNVIQPPTIPTEVEEYAKEYNLV